MKIKNAKGYILGTVIGATLMFSAQSFAEDGLTEIKALLRTGLNITLDGKKVTLENPSINYNGSTYIKLRDAGKLTGTGVVWNEKTQTVEMSSVSSDVYGVDDQVESKPQVTPEPTPHVSPVPSEDSSTNNLYISLSDVTSTINNDKYGFKYDFENKHYSLIFNDTINHDLTKDVILIDIIPTYIVNGRSSIEKSFFQDKILPLIK